MRGVREADLNEIASCDETAAAGAYDPKTPKETPTLFWMFWRNLGTDESGARTSADELLSLSLLWTVFFGYEGSCASTADSAWSVWPKQTRINPMPKDVRNSLARLSRLLC